MAILSKTCKPNDFESHNSLKLSLKFCWLWIFHQIKLSWHSCSMWEKPGWLNWFCQFLCERTSSFNLKAFYYFCAWSRNLCEFTFARDLSLENSADSYLCFRLALLHSVPYFFFLYRSPPSCLCTIFYFVSSNIDEVLLIKPSANVFVFGDYNVHDKDWERSEY